MERNGSNPNEDRKKAFTLINFLVVQKGILQEICSQFHFINAFPQMISEVVQEDRCFQPFPMCNCLLPHKPSPTFHSNVFHLKKDNNKLGVKFFQDFEISPRAVIVETGNQKK